MKQSVSVCVCLLFLFVWVNIVIARGNDGYGMARVGRGLLQRYLLGTNCFGNYYYSILKTLDLATSSCKGVHLYIALGT